MFGPFALTHAVYVLIGVVFVGVIAYVVWYSRRQRARLESAERMGFHPQSVEEGIVNALGRTETERPKPTQKNA